MQSEQMSRDCRGVEQWEQGSEYNDLLDLKCITHVQEDPKWPGSSVKVLNPVPSPYRESVRYTDQNLCARARELVGYRDPRYRSSRFNSERLLTRRMVQASAFLC
jgi:hypothetical protein